MDISLLAVLFDAFNEVESVNVLCSGTPYQPPLLLLFRSMLEQGGPLPFRPVCNFKGTLEISENTRGSTIK
jgi:hypothetical protein